MKTSRSPPTSSVIASVSSPSRCSSILGGDTARLLLLAPHWSGKCHAAYAGLRPLLASGYREESITVHQVHDLGRSYEPSLIENTTAVTVIDGLTSPSTWCARPRCC
ncbi:hypothetical protein ACH4D5_23960 [Streptomyces sp. NPDC018029]|uniref:hypothetical protein n=1 Tax=Streptomyces sp. NPDC018029 TaxID=3365032 RepID=UPI0037B70F29